MGPLAELQQIEKPAHVGLRLEVVLNWVHDARFLAALDPRLARRM